MKKILGISLCALFAVSAANANIASQEYVDEVVGAIDTTGIGVNAGNITALDGRVTTSEEKISTLEGKVSTNETNIAANAGNITTNAGNITANANAIADINEDIAGMTANVTGSHFIQGVSQSNGTVTATGKNFETTLSATTNDNAPTSKAVADHVKGAINALNVTATTGDYVKVVSQSNGSVQATGASFDDEVTATSENAPTSKAVATYVDGKVSDLDVGALEGRVTANEGAITALQTSTTGLAALAYKDTVATADIDANAVTSAQIANDAVTSAKIDDETITNADISGTAAIASSKIAFTDAQKTVFNSGINSGHVTQIGTNARNIASNTTNIESMGNQVTTNTGNITDLQGRMTTAETKIGNNANAISAINSILNASGTEACNTAAGCTLVHDSTGFKWEAVKR